MKALLALVVLCGATLVACESHFVAPRLDVDALTVTDAAPLLIAAHAEKARGLDDANAKERYFSLLRDACELGHSSEACLEANAFAPARSKILVAHACAIGCEDACNTMFIDEVIRDRRTATQATEDVMRIVQLGCVQGISPRCVKSVTNGDMAKLKAKFGVTLPHDAAQDEALEQCVGFCRERRVSCTRQCDLSNWSRCPKVEQCESEETTCDSLCQVDAVAMCEGPLGDDCALPAAYSAEPEEG